jgi:amino acid transporter
MNPKANKYLIAAGILWAVLFLNAFYLGRIADACDQNANLLPPIVSVILLIIFIGLIFRAPLGKSDLQKLIYGLSKVAVIVVLVGFIYFISISLCF